MNKLTIFMAAMLALCGCTTTGVSGNYAQDQKRKLMLAQNLLEDNRVAVARDILTTISNEPGVLGVTDEALFRLALLNLEAGDQKIATGKSGRNLDKLIKYYPTSSWKNHAVTLKGMLDTYDGTVDEKTDLEKTARSLRNSNQALTRELKELRQDMERLKNLELELETKKKR